MKLADQCILPARPEAVWRALNDPAVLEACLPGCKSLAMLDERHFESTVQIRVGPVAATFKSNVELSDLDPPRAYTIVGTGNAGAVQTDAIPAHGHPASLTLTLPPLSTVIFKYNLVLSDPSHPGAGLT